MTSYEPTAQDQFCILKSGKLLCYRTYGAPENASVILIAGLGVQLTFWPKAFIDGFVNRGFQVIAVDNRDCGCSDHWEGTPPSLLQKVVRIPPADTYDLGDMAEDILELMTSLDIYSAHVLGMSMGGMIAQTLAARHQTRIRSMTSIFSTTGSLKVGQPAIKTMRLILRTPPRTLEQYVDGFLSMFRLIGSHDPFDERAMEKYAAQAWERGGGSRILEGQSRHIAAIIKSGDRTQELSRIACNCLVIHGDTDLMVNTSGGYATAAAIKGATLVILPGMGHSIPMNLIPILVDMIAGHMQRS
jgi:pimeloyl-ACP methyl ester carboxylesterase